MATHSENFPSMQQDMLRRRLPVVVAGLVVISIGLITRMVLFQAPNDPRVAAYVELVRDANYSSTQRQTSARGIIYDRTGKEAARLIYPAEWDAPDAIALVQAVLDGQS